MQAIDFQKPLISLPTTKDLKRARRLAKKTRASVACEACKKIKRRCGDYRPCPRCIANGIEQSCVIEPRPEMQQISRAERPISYDVTSIDFGKEPAFPKNHLKHEWSSQLIQPMWSFGFRFSSYSNIYNAIPQPMSNSMESLFSSLQTIMEISARNKSAETNRLKFNSRLELDLHSLM